jgi:hypothetical protein
MFMSDWSALMNPQMAALGSKSTFCDSSMSLTSVSIFLPPAALDMYLYDLTVHRAEVGKMTTFDL